MIDEIHNWKSGISNGADDYKKMFRGAIDKTLLMSATPFQIDPTEFNKLFETVIIANENNGTTKALNALYSESDGLVHKCINSSRAFHQAWAALSYLDLAMLRSELAGQDMKKVITQLKDRAGHSLAICDFLKAVDVYHSDLKSLETSLGKLMVRHTKERIRLATNRLPNRHYHSGISYRKRPEALDSIQVTRLPSATPQMTKSWHYLNTWLCVSISCSVTM